MRATPAAFLVALIVSFSGSWAETPEPDRERRPGFARSTYRWPFASGPLYGEVAGTGLLHTQVGSFDLRRSTPSLPPELRAGPGSRYAILQVERGAFADGRFDRLRTLLESQGGVLLDAMAVSAYVVRVSPALHGLLRAQPGVIAVEPYHPAFKLAPSIGRVPLPDRARAVSDVYRLEAMVFRGENAEEVAASLRGLGAEITRVDPDVVFFELSREHLADVARIEAVKAVFESLPNQVQGEETAIAVQTATWGNGASPFHDVGVRGEGQVLMVLDTGLQLDAGDLSDTRTSAGTPGPAHRKVLLYTTAVDGAGDALGCDAPGAHARARRGRHRARQRHRCGRGLRRRMARHRSQRWPLEARRRRPPRQADALRRAGDAEHRCLRGRRGGGDALPRRHAGVGIAGGRPGPWRPRLQLLLGHHRREHLRHQRAAERPVPLRSPGRDARRGRGERRLHGVQPLRQHGQPGPLDVGAPPWRGGGAPQCGAGSPPEPGPRLQAGNPGAERCRPQDDQTELRLRDAPGGLLP